MNLYKKQIRALANPHYPVGMGVQFPHKILSEWIDEELVTNEKLSEWEQKLDEWSSLELEVQYVKIDRKDLV